MQPTSGKIEVRGRLWRRCALSRRNVMKVARRWRLEAVFLTTVVRSSVLRLLSCWRTRASAFLIRLLGQCEIRRRSSWSGVPSSKTSRLGRCLPRSWCAAWTVALRVEVWVHAQHVRTCVGGFLQAEIIAGVQRSVGKVSSRQHQVRTSLPNFFSIHHRCCHGGDYYFKLPRRQPKPLLTMKKGTLCATLQDMSRGLLKRKFSGLHTLWKRNYFFVFQNFQNQVLSRKTILQRG